MILSDVDIIKQMRPRRDRLVITPWNVELLQPASVDLQLGSTFQIQVACGWEKISCTGVYIVQPGEFLLACSLQYIELPTNLVARVEGKSSLGRQGLFVHITAGFVDPGFKGDITLELHNVSKVPIPLTYRQKICQLSFQRLLTRCSEPYGHPQWGSHYQYQRGATASGMD